MPDAVTVALQKCRNHISRSGFKIAAANSENAKYLEIFRELVVNLMETVQWLQDADPEQDFPADSEIVQPFPGTEPHIQKIEHPVQQCRQSGAVPIKVKEKALSSINALIDQYRVDIEGLKSNIDNGFEYLE